MKTNVFKFSLVLIGMIAMLNVSSVLAQTFTGDIYLTSQAEVDAFNYSEVTGCLEISGEGIVSLGPLNALTSIGNYLYISGNPEILSMENAFPNLNEVGGGIYVYDTSLVTFAGFDALIETGDNIEFWYNNSLTTISGFGALQSAGYSLEFGGNPVLTEIPEFGSLQTIAGSLFIMDNFSLETLSGFSALQYVDWSFQVLGNDNLSSVCGFYNYFSANNPYTGGGSFNLSILAADYPAEMTIQDVLDAGPCVPTAEQRIAQLISDSGSMNLPRNVQNRLLGTMINAQKSLEDGKLNTARHHLEALISTIGTLEQRGKIKVTSADKMLADVDAILYIINS